MHGCVKLQKLIYLYATYKPTNITQFAFTMQTLIILMKCHFGCIVLSDLFDHTQYNSPLIKGSPTPPKDVQILKSQDFTMISLISRDFTGLNDIS